MFQRARRVLRDELGIDPGPELSDLQRTVLADQRPTEPVTVHKPSEVPAQLPADVSGFTGREGHLAKLDALLSKENESSSVMMISAIAGTGGVGKTALAVHWAHRVRHRFDDGQLYINLHGYGPGPAVPPVHALARFLRALGVPGNQMPSEVDEVAALYRSRLANKRVLILLDNASHADQVRPLLPGSPHCLAVVTSRDRLAALIARDGAVPLTLDVLTDAEAHTLLARLVGDRRIDAEPQAVADLAHLCGHLPLALRIAAASALLDAGPEVTQRLLDRLAGAHLIEEPTPARSGRVSMPRRRSLSPTRWATDCWPSEPKLCAWLHIPDETVGEPAFIWMRW